MANAAIQHHVDIVDTSRKRLMGRHAAGEGFLQGFVRHSGVQRYYCFTASRQQFADFKRRLKTLDADPDAAVWVTPTDAERLRAVGCVHLGGPAVGEYAWHRRTFDPSAYSVCGVTHTTASERAMDALGNLLLAPVQPWDALICTSQSVRTSILRVLRDWRDYLGERIGSKPKLDMQMPVIPLGVDCDSFAQGKLRAEQRQRMRKRLRLADDEVALLFVGRLSYHAKAHPLPMYRGAEAAARRTGRRIALIQAGWFANREIERQFRDAAAALCPSVRTLFLDGREAAVRTEVWPAADIFVSLSDNVQETFGLTPIEAMAAGLPVVVSDWDGYRDTVRNGLDGFTVPTLQPPEGTGELFARRWLLGMDSYDRYIGQTSLCVSIDQRVVNDVLTRLVEDADLRARMGWSGLRRAREKYDWRVVIAAYQELWAELGRRRARAGTNTQRPLGRPAHPLRPDPFRAFRCYASAVLDESWVVGLTADLTAEERAGLLSLQMNSYAAEDAFLAAALRDSLIRALERYGPCPVRQIRQLYPPLQRERVMRTLLWLDKIGVVRVERSPP